MCRAAGTDRVRRWRSRCPHHSCHSRLGTCSSARWRSKNTQVVQRVVNSSPLHYKSGIAGIIFWVIIGLSCQYSASVVHEATMSCLVRRLMSAWLLLRFVVDRHGVLMWQKASYLQRPAWTWWSPRALMTVSCTPLSFTLHQLDFVLLSTHADRQGVDISFVVCNFVCLFVRSRISPPRIKQAASNFACRFIGVSVRESLIFVNFALPEAQNQAHRRAREGWWIFQLVTPRRAYQVCAACGRRIGMCWYTAIIEDGRTCF